MSGWKSRIVGHEKVRADQLLGHPLNHRKHPQGQRDVVAASIRELGFVKSVLVNKTTGRIVDGHERVMTALGEGDDTLVDVEYIELSEEEELKALLILDASSEMATVDKDALELLLSEVVTGEQAIESLMRDMGEKIGFFEAGEIDAPNLKDGDREPFQQMTFMLHDSQAEDLKQAIAKAKQAGIIDLENQNANGNAIAAIARAYLGKC